MPSNVNIMALTATATRTLRVQIVKLLGMIDPMTMIRSPDKANIRYANIQAKSNSDAIFKYVLKELQMRRTLLPRIIIFCKFKSDVGRLYTYFQANMASDFTEPPGVPERIPDCRLVDMFFKGTDSNIKSQIIANFTKPSSLRIVISTVAFGMGINCPDVRLIIHLGVPSDIETYVQQVGRAGRDGVDSYAVLLYSPRLLSDCSDSIKKYAQNTATCRWDMLFNDFENFYHSAVKHWMYVL